MGSKMNGKNGSRMKENGGAKGSYSSNANTTAMAMDDILHGLPPNPYKWSEEEVAEWIKECDYSQYMELFTQQHVNGEALLALNKDDFGELGIYALGHTKNILNKIQKLQKYAMKYKARDP